MRAGKALRDHRAIMAQPFVPRTLDEEERAGYDVGRRFAACLPPEHALAMLDGVRAEVDDADPVKAARARGFVRGMTEPR